MILLSRANVVVAIGFLLLIALSESLIAQSQVKLIGSLEVKVDGKYQPATLPLKELEDGATLEVLVTGSVESGITTPVSETTGTVIHFQNKTWELDLSSDPQMVSDVAANERGEFIVVGRVRETAGIKVKNRTILTVESHTITPVGN
jgi:hypothetical protein